MSSFSLSLWHEHDQINDVYDLFSNGSTKTKILKHVYIYIHTVYVCVCKMFEIGESRGRACKCLLYYFFYRFEFFL